MCVLCVFHSVKKYEEFQSKNFSVLVYQTQSGERESRIFRVSTCTRGTTVTIAVHFLFVLGKISKHQQTKHNERSQKQKHPAESAELLSISGASPVT